MPMDETVLSHDLTARVRGLLEKYGKTAPESWCVVQSPPPVPSGDRWTLLPGWSIPAAGPDDMLLPLLPWRSERRFQELRRLVEDRTVSPLLMCRFSCMTDGRTMDLAAVLYREFDLAEWLSGSPIAAVHASIQAGRWANVILRLADGTVCGVEVGVTLPAGTTMIDRHELIARRGVACDRVVDSQVPQNSVYMFTAAGAGQYTDVDAELFGLSTDDVNLVRAAYDALANFQRADVLRGQHRRLAGLVRTAFESDRCCQRLAAEGAC